MCWNVARAGWAVSVVGQTTGLVLVVGFHPTTWARLLKRFPGGYTWTLGPVTYVKIGG